MLSGNQSCTIVRSKYHQCPIGNAQLLHPLQNPTDGIIKLPHSVAILCALK